MPCLYSEAGFWIVSLDGRKFTLGMCGRDHLDFAEPRGQQDQASSRLWNTVVGTANNSVVIVSSLRWRKAAWNSSKTAYSSQAWDILHRDDLGPQCGDHFSELRKQLPLGIAFETPIGVRGKRLTGSAACKNPDTSSPDIATPRIAAIAQPHPSHRKQLRHSFQTDVRKQGRCRSRR